MHTCVIGFPAKCIHIQIFLNKTFCQSQIHPVDSFGQLFSSQSVELCNNIYLANTKRTSIYS